MQPRPHLPVRQSWRRAKIIFNQRSSVFDCAIRSLTGEGAELVMISTLGVPSTFELRLEPSGEKLFCNILRRTETELAVTLQEPAVASPIKTNRAGGTVIALPGNRRPPRPGR